MKRRCRKCPRILDLDTCSPSYGQKKGRESKWQFDSRPLKVEKSTSSRCPIRECDTPLKRSRQGYNFGLDLVAIQGQGKELRSLKVPGVRNRDTWWNFGTPIWESREFVPFGCGCGGAALSILYGGWWWHPPSSGRGESCGLKCPWLVPTPKGVPECELTTRVVCFVQNLVTLPSLIPGLPTRPSTPF